jgi:carboxymethylenebutenolidase
VAPEAGQAGPPGPAPVEHTAKMSAPLLGIFGNDDTRPNPAEVDRTEAALKEHNKPYEFHRYDGAAHGFWASDRQSYRQAQAVDGWNKTWTFFEKHLAQ